MIVLPEWSSLGLFVIAALVLLRTPGPELTMKWTGFPTEFLPPVK